MFILWRGRERHLSMCVHCACTNMHVNGVYDRKNNTMTSQSPVAVDHQLLISLTDSCLHETTMHSGAVTTNQEARRLMFVSCVKPKVDIVAVVISTAVVLCFDAVPLFMSLISCLFNGAVILRQSMMFPLTLTKSFCCLNLRVASQLCGMAVATLNPDHTKHHITAVTATALLDTYLLTHTYYCSTWLFDWQV